MSLLETRGLRSGYGDLPVLHDVDFAVAEGEFVGILGHNGMGKTTLLRTLMGYLPATGGQVHFAGMDITRLPTPRRARLGIGFVPQGREIFPLLSVRDNLRMGLAIRSAAEEAEAMDAVLAAFPRLSRLLDRQGGALSGGEQQLLALARCLCTDPRLILLDEPTEGIQPSILDEIIETLLHLRRSRKNFSLVLVEQNLDFISALSDRVLIIQKGRFIQQLEAASMSDAGLVGEYVGFSR